ncbi:glycosyltransferase family 4 protein [Paraflavisolibacter sp. H34]|uniref:glycosyltransferase family 4 protein n=1 Tax=Huijunlia imazamoxiresistens TaxID=3127457 RepID=UPI0030165605
MKRLAIVVTHPIQYYAPVFQALSRYRDLAVKVFYTWGEGSLQKYDPGFRREIRWDIPLLEGYDYVFLKNTSARPGSSHFKGIVNPDARAAINEFDPQAVLVYGWAYQTHLQLLWAFRRKRKVWFRGDSTLLDETGGWKKLLRAALLGWVYRHIDLAFYVGTSNRKYFQKFGLTKGKLKFAPHAIDNGRFAAPQPQAVRQLRSDLGIPQNGRLVLFAGKLEPKKDPLALLEAFLTLRNEQAYLLFAGNGVLEKELKERAMASPKKEKIRFLAFQNQGQMPRLYQCCQLFCLPSRGPGETWGLAVNEAMASGRAVLVSDKVGCATDLVREGKNGRVFPAGNVAALGAALEQLLADAGALRHMGRQSSEIIQSWSFDHQAASIREELLKIQED